jgi:hypothetical protein
MNLIHAVIVLWGIGSLSVAKPVPLPSAEPDDIIEYLLTRAEYSPLLEENESQAMRDLSQSVRENPERYEEAFRSRFIEAMDTDRAVSLEDAIILLHYSTILHLFPRDDVEDLALMAFECMQAKIEQARALSEQADPMSVRRSELVRIIGRYGGSEGVILDWAIRHESDILVEPVLARVENEALRGALNNVMWLPYLESRATSAPQVIPRLTLLSIRLDGVADREVGLAKSMVDQALERAK